MEIFQECYKGKYAASGEYSEFHKQLLSSSILFNPEKYVTIFYSYLSEPRDILLPELLSLSLSTLSGEVRDEEKLESRAEEKAPELRLLRPPYPLSLNIELEAVLEWNDDNKD